MRLVSISDIHINSQNPEGLNSFIKFCEHPLVKDSTHVALMGDIFDLMVGNHKEYKTRWGVVFDQIQKFCEEGKIVYFAEGNHDMHLKRYFNELAKSFNSNHQHLVHVNDYIIVKLNGKNIYLGHGDEINENDTAYLKYKKFIKKPFWSFVADYIMPLGLLDFLGAEASKKSRHYGALKFNEAEVRNNFRKGLIKFEGMGLDFFVGGHSHVEDIYNHKNFLYLNNGYPPRSKKFIVIDSEGGRLEQLM